MTSASSATRTKLAKYRAKRDFSKTAEPSGNKAPHIAGHAYLIQKHAARRLHYDFRLELGGVLKSWAVTRGPSLNPKDKRLAVHVEDHPLDYGSFEGTIAQGQYGGGTVMLWDQGTWDPIGDPQRDYARGNLTFELNGKRLKGRWHLVRLRGNRPGDGKRENWLLIKGKDAYANANNGDLALQKNQKSVVSGRGMEGIAKAAGQSWSRSGARSKRPPSARYPQMCGARPTSSNQSSLPTSTSANGLPMANSDMPPSKGSEKTSPRGKSYAKRRKL